MLIALKMLSRNYKIMKCLYAQFDLIRSNHIRFCYRNRHQ
jgi:hypothetical protein